eukprot:scaffold37522_cov31-Phaeocystis_antarctica.AAC.2
MAFMNSRPTEQGRPRLLVEQRVLGHRLPSASRRKSSASRPHTTSQRAGQPVQDHPLQRLAAQRLSGGEVALGHQQPTEHADGDERVQMPIPEGITHPLQRLAEQRLGGGEVALDFQQPAEHADGEERVRVTTAEGLAPPLQRLAEQWLGGGEVALGLQQQGRRLAAQRLSGGEVALGHQQPAEVADGGESALMPIAERLALHLHSLAAQRLSGGDLALDQQQRAEVIDDHERVRMPIAEGITHPLQRLAEQRLSGGERAEVVHGHERVRVSFAVRLACHLQRLAEQWLSGGVVALGVQQQAMVAQGDERRACDLRLLVAQLRSLVALGGTCVLAIRALCLGPCTQKLDAQRIAVLVHALAAAEGRVLT